MNKNFIGLSLAFGVICLMVLSSFPTVLSNNNELPDLIIEDVLIKKTDSPEYADVLACRIKNIGDSSLDESDSIKLNVTAVQMVFGIFPLRIVATHRIIFSSTAGLKPSGTIDLKFTRGSGYPFFGFFRFHCIVNPERNIIEKDYDNNCYAETFFGFWTPLGYYGWIPIG